MLLKLNQFLVGYKELKQGRFDIKKALDDGKAYLGLIFQLILATKVSSKPWRKDCRNFHQSCEKQSRKIEKFAN